MDIRKSLLLLVVNSNDERNCNIKQIVTDKLFKTFTAFYFRYEDLNKYNHTCTCKHLMRCPCLC